MSKNLKFTIPVGNMLPADKNLKAIELRTDIIAIENIIKSFAYEYPDATTRKNILNEINKICTHKVIDKSEPEDIDNGQFVYAIQANEIQEVIVKFNQDE